MREILFRGQRDGQWVYGGLDTAWGLSPEQRERYWIVVPYRDPVFVDPLTIGQYIGLLDRNGRKIFEGDIVKSIALSNDHNQRGAIVISPVEYWCGNACLSITYIPIYPFCVDHDIEVIGNAHDNPELLKSVSV